jgi:hypothetical protein
VDPEASSITAAVSVDRSHFAQMSGLRMRSTDVQCLSVFSDFLSGRTDIAIVFERDETNHQLSVIFFAPCVLFNSTQHSLVISDFDATTRKSVTVSPSLYQLWCPVSYLTDGRLNISVSIPGKARSPVSALDCSHAARDIVFLPAIKHKELFLPIRCNIAKIRKTSVVTFSSYLTIHNNLAQSIVLQPILSIPKSFDDGVGAVGLASRSLLIGESQEVRPNSVEMIDFTTTSAAFLFSVAEFATSPALSFLSTQKTVFRVQGLESGMKIIELEVTDDLLTHHAYFHEKSCPTPILINNGLDVMISAYQMISITPFVIEPNSTSVFAYDEPFAYPSVHLSFADCNLNISLLEDTRVVQLTETYQDLPVLIRISPNPNGTRTLVISTTRPEERAGDALYVAVHFNALHISFIDLVMREFALLTVKDISLDLQFDQDNYTFGARIDRVQIDDQNPGTQFPVVLFGRKLDRLPFMTFEIICPSDAVLSRFSYVNLVVQRIDVVLDSAFVSDCYDLVMSLSEPIPQIIAPVERSTSSAKSLVSIGWLQISPIYVARSFKSTRTRPRLGPMLPYFKFVPSLTNMRILLPGVLIAQITDFVSDILDKITADYKRVVFEQIMSTLGLTGRLITQFGITESIIQLLDIKRQSDLTGELAPFARHQSERFSNRREIAGCFSREVLNDLNEKLSMCQVSASQLVRDLLNESSIGLKIKMMPGCGFGHGVFGVLMKSATTAGIELAVMAGATRARVPRAYPNGHIDAFDVAISNAQSLIQQQMRQERIRMAFRLQNSGLLCLTDRFAISFLPNGNHVVGEFEIAKLDDVLIKDNVLLVLKMKLKDVSWKFASETDARQAWHFVKSQRTILTAFRTSLLP